MKKNQCKRSAFCFSVDFQANEAQAALNGQVSALVGGLPHHHNYHHCHHHNFLFVGFIINLMITQDSFSVEPIILVRRGHESESGQIMLKVEQIAIERSASKS